MLNFVLKHLIKDYKNINDKKVRNSYGFFSCIFGIVINFIIFILEFIIGLLTNSSSIFINSFHDLTDSIASIISLIGFKLSNKKADKQHPMGFGRYEYISSVITSMIICFIGLEFIQTSFTRILHPQVVQFNIILILITFCTIPLKFILSYVLFRISKLINSESLFVTATDCRNDLVVLVSIIVSIFISYYFKINIDGYISMAIALFILVSGLKSLKESIEPLLGEAPDINLVNNINNIVLENKNIISTHDLIIHNYGINTNIATIHVVMINNLKLEKADIEVDKISKEIKDKLNVDLLIHIDTDTEYYKIKNEHIVKLGIMRKWFN